jgi:DNA (cytosine-5)-methyltransferase 1
MPVLLDLFCGGGGCSVGYNRAGFTVVGVDVSPQKRYPFEFHQDDAIEFCDKYGKDFDIIHASPPCQKFSVTSSLWDRDHPDLINATRDVLVKSGKPYVIENVTRAPLVNPLMLCGTMFGLRVIRHRHFECSPQILMSPMSCNHWAKASSNRSLNKDGIRVTPNLTDFDIMTIVGHDFIVKDAAIAMGIDWMSSKEIAQAIPPAYTEYIGKCMLEMCF